jgi:2,4'-dihydroxyacetophenone dioxygenase
VALVPAGSVHTFMTPATNTEDTVLFLRPEGANVNFTENEKFHSILDAVTIQHLVTQLAEPAVSARSITSPVERPAS